jgi:ribosome biogenesis GTPase
MARHIPLRRVKSKRRRPFREDLSDATAGKNGLIICNYGQTLDVDDQSGRIHRCTTRSKIDNPVCGDRVLWLPAGRDQGVIVALQARQTLLARPDGNGTLKPIAANVDRLIVVTAPRTDNDSGRTSDEDPPIDTSLVDRYLIAAELSGIHALIVVNKIDLLSPADLARARLFMETYQDIGYQVLFTTAKHSPAAEKLLEALKAHTNVFCGPSGVGKSSLVKAVLPDRDIRIGEVSATGGGRHTTALTTFYRLEQGGALIDSPGVRDFGLWHVDAVQIARGFTEFGRHAPDCRFSDCIHLHEPGCAVRRAVEAQQVSATRLASYRRIIASLQH